ncbi:MAG: hypothetical protein E7636_05950 [Ruminococcaceae bacterium]|nr:hypothetical protein [Oscillospiraceae bacterium]
MSEKVILILADGMRPDALTSCGHPFVEKMKEMATYTLGAHRNASNIKMPASTNSSLTPSISYGKMSLQEPPKGDTYGQKTAKLFYDE